MSRAEKVLLLLGLAGFTLLVRKMDLETVLWAFRAAGWGLLFLVLQELVAYLLNTLGWRACLAPEHRKAPLSRLLRIRIISDALNYLIPSGAVAGTWTKSVMLGEEIPLGSRLSSAVMAKLAQTLAMALTAGLGLIVLILGKDLGDLHSRAVYGLAALTALAVALVGAGALFASGRLDALFARWSLARESSEAARSLLRDRPGQLALGVLFFGLAYLWGGFEAYWICRFLGAPVGVLTALKIEVLSIFLDAAFFYVPAKAGTQESTKTLIFLALGRPAAQGFAFGLLRHFRELTWALVGLLLSRSQPPAERSSPPAPRLACSLV